MVMGALTAFLAPECRRAAGVFILSVPLALSSEKANEKSSPVLTATAMLNCSRSCQSY